MTSFLGDFLTRHLRNQRGAFSPFMFGLLMAIGIFSTLAMHWAKKDLIRIQEERAERVKAEAEDIAKAVEFTIMTETASTFGQDFNIDELRQHTGRSQGKTRGQQDIQLIARDSETVFDLTNQRIAIAATDDPLAQTELRDTPDAKGLARAAKDGLDPVIIVDTGAIRKNQVAKSVQRLEQMAEQVYQFYAANFRFPTESEYDQLQDALKIKDIWGNDFYYTYRNDEEALLEFTSPWN
ncbi:MAG: hypothetical protein OXQ96_01035, partial [Alphaproteobacteria bacterium]|nr:hypothetical protein [Alphaproteobacteria bacterium]